MTLRGPGKMKVNARRNELSGRALKPTGPERVGTIIEAETKRGGLIRPRFGSLFSRVFPRKISEKK